MARYFSDDEIKGLDQELVIKLDQARALAGVPFVITSGLRTDQANSAAFGVEDSAHLSGKAVDLRCPDGAARFAMVKALMAVGFRRLGIYTAHLHCDLDEGKAQDVIWTGVSH